MSSIPSSPVPRRYALLPAAGAGSRMGADRPKQYLEIAGRPLLWHALRRFQDHPGIDAMMVVISPGDEWWDGYDWRDFSKLMLRRVGGDTRAASVRNGLAALAEAGAGPDDWVLVHDAARPCLSRPLLDRLLDTLRDDPVGGLLAAPVADTLKRADAAGRVAATVSREAMWGAQTPQMFRHGLLGRALDQAGLAVTDESSAVETLGLAPRLVESDLSNLKVTYPRDLEVAAWWLAREGGP